MKQKNTQTKTYFIDIVQKGINNFINNFLQLKKENKDMKVCIKIPYANKIDKEKLKTYVKKVINKLRKNSVSSKDISVVFEYNDNLDKLDLEMLKKWESEFNKNGIKFGVLDQLYIWNTSEVEKTINTINESANNIKQLHLSPLETLLNAYISVTKRKYKFEKNDENFAISRSVVGVSNNDAIVCSGYVELLSSLINKIDDGNVKVFRNNVLIEQDNKIIAGHTNLIAYVKDDKYKIDGYYYLDPTWDYQRENDNYLRLNYFMVPLQNIKEIKNYNIKDVFSQKKDFDINSIVTTNYVQSKFKLSKNNKNSYIFYNISNPINGLSFSKNGLHLDNIILNNLLNNINTKDKILKAYDEHLKNNFSSFIDFIKISDDLYNSTLKKFISNQHDLIENVIYENSEQIDLQALKDALYNVLCKNSKNKDKSQIYALTEKTLENNIKMSGQKYNKNAKDAFSECEYFDK